MNTVRNDIRNVAIIAHVDHGKTTLVDALLRQSGNFRDSQVAQDTILDSNPIERERGITILAKNCAILHHDPETGVETKINLIDTPGHADFGGEVERVLSMADGCFLLVDAAEGPMPQTRFVLKKAFQHELRPIVVINKVDKPDARVNEVLNEIFDLFVELGADDETLDFPVLYASGRDGWATWKQGERGADIRPVFDALLKHVPAPHGDPAKGLQVMITAIDYSEYVGRIGIGRIYNGRVKKNDPVIIVDRHGVRTKSRIGSVLAFDGLGRREVEAAQAGDIVALVGLEKVDIGDTICDAENPEPLVATEIEPPTLTMTFRVNDSPFVGREGKFVTSRNLRDRLMKELESNVALKVQETEDKGTFMVSGRGLLHLGILVENMRREGFELSIGKPQVVTRTDEGGQVLEPIEYLVVDVPENSMGPVMELVGGRRGELVKLENRHGSSHLEFTIPARGLIGLRTKLLTATQGEAIMHHNFHEFAPSRGEVPHRQNGVMISIVNGTVNAYALDNLQQRGEMFVSPGDEVYPGQVVAQNAREDDIGVNPTKAKALTNMRTTSKDDAIILKPARKMTLEQALEYIEDDELVEVTPSAIRIRKTLLDENARKRAGRAAKDKAMAGA